MTQAPDPNQPPGPVPEWTAPPATPKKPIWQRTWFLVLAAVAVIGALGSVFNRPTQPVAGVPASASAPPATVATSTPEPEETEEPDPEPVAVTKSDFTIKLKITEKQCFGSAGCNVTTKASVTYVGIDDLDDLPSMIDITYKIKGAEDPYTATIEMEDGKYSPDTAILSTRRKSDKLTATVTAVESY